jgi:hypothetical protein
MLMIETDSKKRKKKLSSHHLKRIEWENNIIEARSVLEETKIYMLGDKIKSKYIGTRLATRARSAS